MRYLPYEKYKTAKTDLIGDIPDHWEEWKASHGFGQIGSGTTPKSDNSSYYGGETLWVTTSELRETYVFDTAIKVTDEALADHSALKQYPIDSVVIAMYGATIGRLGMLGKSASVNQACCVYAQPEKFHPRFFYFWLWMRRPILISLSSGGGQPNLNQEELKRIRVPLPPLGEQEQIAAFLDWKTGQIDALIVKKKALIEKLKEKRLAVITQAVTKGLDPAVPMRDSGISWLGTVPTTWMVLPIKYLLDSIIDTEHKTCPFYDDGEFLVARTTNIKNGKLSLDGAKYTDANGYREWTMRAVPKAGDILFTREAPAGEACIVPDIPILCVGQRVVLFRTNPEVLDSSFAINSIYGGAARVFIEMHSLGSTVTHFNMSEIAMIPMLVPPLEEQKAISKHLEEKTSAIDLSIQKVEDVVARLTEYRTALITAATTGKIDVRQIEIPAQA